MTEAETAVKATAVLGTIGRKRFCFALTDERGTLRPDTRRSYDAAVTTGVSGALAAYQRDLALPALPSQSAIAVAGLARGDAISITRTRWFLSRSGLQAMLGEPPLILNDFAAEAWALHGTDERPQEMFGGAASVSVRRPGCYLLLGITSGLGSVVINCGETGEVSVLPTEAGHGVFAAVTEELAQLADDLFPGKRPVVAEDVISASGLLAIYALIARRTGAVVRARTPEDVTRTVAVDPISRQACELLSRAFWAQAGSLVMTYGAWDGVFLTGGLAGAIRPLLRRQDAQAPFLACTRYGRVLAAVPRGFVSLEMGELIGTGEALRYRRTLAR